ncbi:MAG: 30S ribosomal protein S13 [Candidatus Magasanikbacteria bacterium RIFCSPHIGHO2_01_FULL_50_8]|uniref:Small ribosomal subunit protein uS13 n=2 Tax=Candidatus Magasanikiibacteriota TaxID=1752731 RepID=A0A1F6LN98_9BACT|nr:MAG: 30S ribosomal protein S13 [Candidatus Magasanikbacteria bacterium RIFCSPHIGHO2_01_FULL_50_8]OGH68163.1 MAG: 30S ribosomal protein S13 [Candidatus Magasanikbacteria bacterium RIFCSPHIGHO2_02_FULL_50_9b]
MARIASVTLPTAKRIEAALPYIYGIGWTKSKEILKATKISPDTRVKDLTTEQVDILSNYINQNYKVEGDLRREVLGNIKRLKEIKCYRGTRHAKNLPARGQRTKTNSRTVRGNKRATMGSGKKPKGMLK